MHNLQDSPESRNRGARHGRLLAWLVPAVLLLAGASLTARADDDLPGRVGRIADFAGQLYLSPEDKASEWQPIGQNYPVSSGDNLWVGGDGRAEVDYGGGQFRLAGDTNLHVSRLDENRVALFIAQGRVIVRVRVLDPGDSAYIDSPNTQIQLTRPGLYRIDVAPDRQSTLVTVRQGEAMVMLANAAQQTLPGQSAVVTGDNPPAADIRNGIGQDGFDDWSASRDRRYERPRATAYVSPQMVGYADLDEYGTWQSTPEYGPVWYPTAVAADWAPYRDGYWTNVGGWGSTWVDAAPWGYAPFHYGRWAWVGGRWGWCPGRFVARPLWAPALVGWVGGAGWGLSAFGTPVYGWVPLGWGEPFHPWWSRCSYNCWASFNRPYAVDVMVRPNNPPSRFRNINYPGALTAVSGATLAGRLPVNSNRVTVPTHQMNSAPVLAAAPAVASGPLRIPGTRAGTAGTPPPASTFYPVSRAGRPGPETMVRPPASGTGSGAPSASQTMNRPTTVAPAAKPAQAVPGATPAYARPTPAVTPGAGGSTPSPAPNATDTASAPVRSDTQSRPRPKPPQPQQAGVPATPSSSQSTSTPPAQSVPVRQAPVARTAPPRLPTGERVAPLPGTGTPVAAPGAVPHGGVQAAPGVLTNQETRLERPAQPKQSVPKVEPASGTAAK
jgi:hypothetical protein